MSPETIARSVQQLNAAGVTWPTTHRVAVTVRLAGLADVIALGDGVLVVPEALVEPVEAPATRSRPTRTAASSLPEPTATSGPRVLPVRPVRRAATDGPA
jgi:hypothetical protein